MASLNDFKERIANDPEIRKYLSDNQIDIRILENPLLRDLDSILQFTKYCLDKPAYSSLLRYLINDVLPKFRTKILQTDNFSNRIEDYYSHYKIPEIIESIHLTSDTIDSLRFQISQLNEEIEKSKKENERLKRKIQELEQKDSDIQSKIQAFNDAKKCMTLNIQNSSNLINAYIDHMSMD